MPVWFIMLSIFAALGALAAQSGDVVLTTSIESFGVMIPIWYVAANLWWVMLVVSPWVWLAHRGKSVWGFGVSLALFVGLVGGLSLQISQSRSQFVRALPVPEAGLAVADGAPHSLEIAMAGPEVASREHECSPLCERLLAGPDIAWIRVQTGATVASAPKSMIYYRADAAECRAYDASFPGDAVCLLAKADDGARADLRLDFATQGDGFSALQTDHGWVYLTQTQSLTLTDLRIGDGKVLDQRTRYVWIEPEVAPFLPGMTALGSGRKFDGIRLPRRAAQTAALDPAAILTNAGLHLGPERSALALTAVTHAASETGPYAVPTAYDAPLLASLLQVADPLHLTEGQSRMVADWAAQFRVRLTAPIVREPTPAERAILQGLTKVSLPQGLGVGALMGEQPGLFTPDFRGFYAQIGDSDPTIATRAAMVILDRLRTDPLGSHDSEAPEYLAALKNPLYWGYLVQVVGRYGFDPTPILQDALATHPDNQPFIVASAACQSDPKWAAMLGPFVHDQMVPLLSNLEGHKDTLRTGTAALVALGRVDLALDLRGRVDWAQVMRDKGPGMNSPTMDWLQSYLLGSLAASVRCP